jgi:hypothetical protein
VRSRAMLGSLDEEPVGKALLNTRDDIVDGPRGVRHDIDAVKLSPSVKRELCRGNIHQRKFFKRRPSRSAAFNYAPDHQPPDQPTNPEVNHGAGDEPVSASDSPADEDRVGLEIAFPIGVIGGGNRVIAHS